MADEEDGGDGLEARVLALGAEGLSRVEIAAALGLGETELAALEAERPAFVAAMRRARVLEQAWWEALPREALAAGHRFNLAGWLGVMRWRWGGGVAAAIAPAAPAAKPTAPLARYEIPDNGRERPRMPQSYYEGRDDAWWRAEEIRDVDAELRGAEESLKQSLRYMRDEERDVAGLRAKLAWLREAPLGAEEPADFLPDQEDNDEETDDDGWN
jgi:hypothetical protein